MSAHFLHLYSICIDPYRNAARTKFFTGFQVLVTHVRSYLNSLPNALTGVFAAALFAGNAVAFPASECPAGLFAHLPHLP